MNRIGKWILVLVVVAGCSVGEVWEGAVRGCPTRSIEAYLLCERPFLSYLRGSDEARLDEEYILLAKYMAAGCRQEESEWVPLLDSHVDVLAQAALEAAEQKLGSGEWTVEDLEGWPVWGQRDMRGPMLSFFVVGIASAGRMRLEEGFEEGALNCLNALKNEGNTAGLVEYLVRQIEE